MSPVPGKPGIGTATALNLTVGAAEATPGSASSARPRTARQVDALRISFPPLLMDRSASIRVAPEPCRSGDIEIPGVFAGEQWRVLIQTLSVSLHAFKFERPWGERA